MDFKAISVILPIFDADNLFACTTSFRIVSKSYIRIKYDAQPVRIDSIPQGEP